MKTKEEILKEHSPLNEDGNELKYQNDLVTVQCALVAMDSYTSHLSERVKELETENTKMKEKIILLGQRNLNYMKLLRWGAQQQPVKEFCTDVKLNSDPSVEQLLNSVDVSYSRGYGKGGKRHRYIHPKNNICLNRSRRVAGLTGDELYDAVIACVKKWYYPMNEFLIEGKVICSNSEVNALKEYWRVCDRADIGKTFEVKKLEKGGHCEGTAP